MNDRNARYARLRYTATGALAALATTGAIAGTVALANPSANKRGHAAAANCAATKTPPSPGPDKTQTPPPVSQQLFLRAVQQLVAHGAITATQAQTVDREIVTGRVDTDTLAAGGFSPAQLQAVEEALGNTKRALAQSVR